MTEEEVKSLQLKLRECCLKSPTSGLSREFSRCLSEYAHATQPIEKTDSLLCVSLKDYFQRC